ncbi:MAG: hypothetical protein LC745_04540, partial [Planctomycetia bacterium]|nr:hypothetical protein [Planctomycetia bacterium]
MRTALAPFERIHFELATEILCARCHAPLERHQPDEEQPERLLGTCGGCGTWYLVDLASSVMIALPVS